MAFEGVLTERVKKSSIFAFVFVIAYLSDLYSKSIARSALEEKPIEIIGGLLQFRITENTGVAFGMMSNNQPALFAMSAVSIIVLIFVVFGIKIAFGDFPYVAVSFVMAGALANFVERAARGFVTDFIEFSFWPSFNLADVFIVAGVFYIFFWYIRASIEKERDAKRVKEGNACEQKSNWD